MKVELIRKVRVFAVEYADTGYIVTETYVEYNDLTDVEVLDEDGEEVNDPIYSEVVKALEAYDATQA